VSKEGEKGFRNVLESETTMEGIAEGRAEKRVNHEANPSRGKIGREGGGEKKRVSRKKRLNFVKRQATDGRGRRPGPSRRVVAKNRKGQRE